MCTCQLLFLAEIVPTFLFGRILPKALFTAKNIEPSMNATSSRVPTAKSGFGCQKKKVWHFGCQKKSLALSLPKIKLGMIVPNIVPQHVVIGTFLHTPHMQTILTTKPMSLSPPPLPILPLPPRPETAAPGAPPPPPTTTTRDDGAEAPDRAAA
jgi:hypothetical protein